MFQVFQYSRYGIKLSVPSAEGMSDLWLRCESELQYTQWMAACRLIIIITIIIIIIAIITIIIIIIIIIAIMRITWFVRPTSALRWKNKTVV